ncbi:hypothetical protein [Muricoccus radiodurans]|uniref:hypothetical protein n=1 Tax=Muricoccus radiodurans TaxID=2231721 RepID=UPI003CE73010
MRRAGPLLAAASVLALAGCDTVADAAGAVAGIATGTAFGNPAVGYAVSLGVRAGASEGLRYVSRRWHRTEQDAIAAAIGTTPPGTTRPWRVRHDLPIGNGEGEVRVLRVIPSALATCREAVFSIGDIGDPPAERSWFTTTACANGGAWQWAVAEPAVPRWGNLQ